MPTLREPKPTTRSKSRNSTTLRKLPLGTGSKSNNCVTALYKTSPGTRKTSPGTRTKSSNYVIGCCRLTAPFTVRASA